MLGNIDYAVWSLFCIEFGGITENIGAAADQVAQFLPGQWWKVDRGVRYLLCMRNICSEINFCLGNKTLIVSLTNLADQQTWERSDSDRNLMRCQAERHKMELGPLTPEQMSRIDFILKRR